MENCGEEVEENIAKSGQALNISCKDNGFGNMLIFDTLVTGSDLRARDSSGRIKQQLFMYLPRWR